MQTPRRLPRTAIQPTGTIALYKVANGSVTQVGSAWSQTNIFDPADAARLPDHGDGDGPGGQESAHPDRPRLRDPGLRQGEHHGLPVHPRTGDRPQRDLPKLDILSFDACLMSQVEVLYQAGAHASYFTAAERTMPTGGYDYTGFLTPLLSNPDQATVTYLNTIVSTYREKYTTPYYLSVVGEPPTLAAIDSSQLQGVVSGLNSLSTALVRDYGTKSQQFNQTMLQVLAKTVKCDGTDPCLDVRTLPRTS